MNETIEPELVDGSLPLPTGQLEEGSAPQDTTEDGEYGARCLCGHYRSEHEEIERNHHAPGAHRRGRCGGAYSTLAADADDREFVEVNCPCDYFHVAEPNWFVVR